MRRQISEARGLPDNHGRRRHAEVVMSALEETVALFFRLRAVMEDIHGHSEISGSMRGVMRDLTHCGPQTVPQMARRRPVSRQHIQAIVNDLQRAGLACLSDNPRHKRSRMVQLTPAGVEAMQQIVAREHAVLSEIDIPISIDELTGMAANMAELRNMLESSEWRRTVRQVLYQNGRAPENPWIDDADDVRDQPEPVSQ